MDVEFAKPCLLVLCNTSACEFSEEDDEVVGACFQSTYSIWNGGSSFNEDCTDDISESICDAWDYTTGSSESSTIFYPDTTCAEAGY